ncbi:hypothetical protein [Streptomyces olivaceus]|uniref:hypothetical protein n=1 Tax=Streptomyces olivaceus TaxID=47716 RepID=UPI001CCEF189|nr:hypothetical protein [Streptomyces olivaceus]MBZ6135445.1 hypothetical protein [Streptomyces olivaceus]
MTITNLDSSAFRSLLSTLTSPAISDFLRGSGWIRADLREGLAEYWLPPEAATDAAENEPYLLPLDEERRDYRRRQAELLADLADYFGDSPAQLVRRITASHFDTLVLRARPAGPDDSVALSEAACLLDAGLEMVTISALYTDNPYRTSWGSRRSAPVAAYLRDGVRLGHTERGSFVFPVLSHLVEPRPAAELPFGREVMMNLAAALGRVHSWGDEALRAEPDVAPFDAAIAKAFKPLAKLADLSLELSFRWASAHALPPAPSPATLAFDVAAAHAIVRKAQQTTEHDVGLLAPRRPGPAIRTRPASHAHVVALTGHVIAIGVDSRNEQHGQSPYFLVLRAGEEDYFMAVSQEEHGYALRAREDHRTVTARGTISVEGGQRTLRGSLVRDDAASRTRGSLER